MIVLGGGVFTDRQTTRTGEEAMKIVKMLALIAIAFGASISASSAGPCSGDIDAMMARIDAALNAKVAAGPGAQQHSTVGGRHVQPTPRSMAAAEEKLGVISPETAQLVRQAMERARDADALGDSVACKEALADVQRMIGP